MLSQYFGEPLLEHFPSARLLRSSLPILKWVARRLEKTFFRNLIGQLLFVKARKDPTTLTAS
jgi:hypothetical protein